MTTDTHHRHEELDADECWSLLRCTETGRVAFADENRIQVLPVNYVVRDGSIFFRTSAYGAIGAGLRDGTASFQIDQFDDFLQAGWSVLVSGNARPVEDTEMLTELWGPERPEPWADGVRSLFIQIRPDRVTGRRVHPG